MDKNDIQTLIHLIKSQSEQTRKELRSEISDVRGEIAKVKTQLEFKVDQLENKLDSKFEEHRRNIVDDFQTFENHLVKENLTLTQEMTVNSARLTKIEKVIFQN